MADCSATSGARSPVRARTVFDGAKSWSAEPGGWEFDLSDGSPILMSYASLTAVELLPSRRELTLVFGYRSGQTLRLRFGEVAVDSLVSSTDFVRDYPPAAYGQVNSLEYDGVNRFFLGCASVQVDFTAQNLRVDLEAGRRGLTDL